MWRRAFRWAADPRGWRSRRTGSGCTSRTAPATRYRWSTPARGAYAAKLSLGGPATLTAEQRRGERLFFNARFAFQGHFGCANCHIEATFDGLSWDLEPDGFGKDIRGQPPARGRRRHRALQMERLQSESGDRVRAAHREVLLPLGELRRLATFRPGQLHQVDAAAAQSVPSQRRADSGPGARQGDFRA